MTMRDPEPQVAEIDIILAQARACDARMPPDLGARLLAQAWEAQPPARSAPRRPAVARAAVARRGWQAAIGGWPALAGLAAATLAGVWIGAAPPAGLTALVADLAGGTVTIAIDPATDLLSLLEG
jgi:hypothetical protein